MSKFWKTKTMRVCAIAAMVLLLVYIFLIAGLHPTRPDNSQNGAMYKVIGQDWDDWLHEDLNPLYVRLEHVTNRFGAMQLGRRIDALWRKLKHPEMAVQEYNADDWYDELWMEKHYESLSDFDITIPVDADNYTTCSWIDDIYHTKHVA